MKKMFLTSSMHTVAQSIAERVDLKKASKLVFIDTASEPEDGDKQWLKDDRQALVDAGFELTDYTITGKNKSKLGKDLKEYDYIYLSGGDTTYLLEESRKSGFFEIVSDLVNKMGKIYIGTSAGSIIAGPSLPEYLYDEPVPGPKERKGFGLVNFTIVPHWGSKDFKDMYLNERLKIAYKDDQIPMVLLTDNQYIQVENNNFSIVDAK